MLLYYTHVWYNAYSCRKYDIHYMLFYDLYVFRLNSVFPGKVLHAVKWLTYKHMHEYDFIIFIHAVRKA
mgnify:CR=1 FL=1